MDTRHVPTTGVEGGLPVLCSAVLGPALRHGFTMRAGGVSAPPFDTLNLGMRWGDAPANVIENRRRVLAASGARALHAAAQVHGARVVRVRAGDAPMATAKIEADALCCGDPGVALAVFVADCVPILIADARTGAVAAVHAGWRGTVAGVVPAAVAALAAEFGSRPADLRVALGPAIGRCCFEVGPEVVAAFEAALPDARRRGVIVEETGRKPHIDLRLGQQLQLAHAGVPPEATDTSADCTRCDPAHRFFSYRRDATRTGQHMAFVTAAATSPTE